MTQRVEVGGIYHAIGEVDKSLGCKLLGLWSSEILTTRTMPEIICIGARLTSKVRGRNAILIEMNSTVVKMRRGCRKDKI